MPVVVTPDCELWATGWLRAALALRAEPYAAGVFVGATVPNPRRDRMVIFGRVGGPRIGPVLEVARISVNVWGQTDQVATDLARLVAALMLTAADGNPVTSVSQTGGLSSIPDVQPRRLITFELTVRGAAA